MAASFSQVHGCAIIEPDGYIHVHQGYIHESPLKTVIQSKLLSKNSNKAFAKSHVLLVVRYKGDMQKNHSTPICVIMMNKTLINR